FVLFPSYIETPESPRLMVFLKDSDEGVSVEKVMESGPAGRAGIQEGDIITALDGLTVKDIQDIKIFLVGRNRGDRIRVRLLRKYFIFGSEKLEVEVDL
ncbi:MAG TPA: PDZ domain-containing protein, partial [Nitrospirae bacterium]|nr:PDZ domain-containing protein [Nitrospirota bacterium]